MNASGLRGVREGAGLTQGELATRAGVSRQMVGAVEAGRHLPRVDAALALAAVLGVDVEVLFGSEEAAVDAISGEPPSNDVGLRLGWVGDRLVSAPARVGADGWDVADGVLEGGRLVRLGEVRPGPVVAGCEPGLETGEHLLRQGGRGGLAVATSSARALAALAGGRAHAAVVHAPAGGLPPAFDGVARFHLTTWTVGLSIPSDIGSSWWSQVLAGNIEVVQREAGASVQRTFEEAVGGARAVSGRRVGGHVISARTGIATGLPAVTIEPAARAVGADFHPLARHVAELWVPEQWTADRGVEDLIDLMGSARFRRRLETVGGYDLEGIGSRVA
ncbi:MAG: helix-turn-helix domain-containing protein [Acidimicrobiia bacterium]